MIDIVLHTIELKQGNLDIVLFFPLITFIVLFLMAGFIKKYNPFYWIAGFFLVIFLFKSYFYFVTNNSLNILEVSCGQNEKIINFNVKNDNEIIEKHPIRFSTIKNLNIKKKTDKSAGGKAGSADIIFNYYAITYVENNNNKKELISTRNLFAGKFISKNDLQAIFQAIKNNKKKCGF